MGTPPGLFLDVINSTEGIVQLCFQNFGRLNSNLRKFMGFLGWKPHAKEVVDKV
jgi:hypothetical protein